MTRTLRKIGLGSLSGIGLYVLSLLLGSIVWAAIVNGTYTSLFTIGDTWTQFTIGDDWAWYTIGIPENWNVGLTTTFNLISNVLTIIIALAIAVWEILYFTKSKEVDLGTAFKVALMGILVIILARILFGTM